MYGRLGRMFAISLSMLRQGLSVNNFACKCFTARQLFRSMKARQKMRLSGCLELGRSREIQVVCVCAGHYHFGFTTKMYLGMLPPTCQARVGAINQCTKLFVKVVMCLRSCGGHVPVVDGFVFRKLSQRKQFGDQYRITAILSLCHMLYEALVLCVFGSTGNNDAALQNQTCKHGKTLSWVCSVRR